MLWVEEVKQLLQNGLYIDNLRRIQTVAWEAVKNNQAMCPAYIICQIAADIADDWEDRPLLVSEAERIEAALRPSIEAVLDAVLNNSSQTEIMASLNVLIEQRVIVL